ncbi:MAG: DNA/RNA non-specific endonuclease [Cryomorphaceae bacterium]|nr:MAG: DNA/RNA non-specific endonuclease [Cryomorphaceae bacterium]
MLILLSACRQATRIAESAVVAPEDNIHLLLSSDCLEIGYHIPCKQPHWVRYTLRREMTEGLIRRKDNFRPDPRIAEGKSAQLTDYKQSGYDRGHLAPAGDMTHSQECMDESFWLSNISPQTAGCNRGVWKRLEEQVRKWTHSHDSILVYTGPILQNHESFSTIGSGEVCVPKSYYKALLFYTQNDFYALAFVIPNENSPEPLASFAMSVRQLETNSGLSFFSHLADTTQQRIEAVENHPKLWE